MSSNCGILIISPERWDQHFVSKHHYAITLAKRGAEVLFLNPPTDSPNTTVLTEVEGYAGITVVDGPRVAPGLRFYPGTVRRHLERRWLERLEAQAGFRVDTVWLFENSRFFDMGFAGDRLKIYHQVDLNQKLNLGVAARSADVCFCTTDFIWQQLSRFNERVYKIHHGLAEVETPQALTDLELQRFNPGQTHAAYIGNLEIRYLDFELMADVIRRFPAVRFHLVGACQENSIFRRLLANAENVVWWGAIDHKKIPALLERVDINLVMYKADLYREQLASPHKFMEYFASGKVVVATYTDEYKDKRDLLTMADSDSDYCALFKFVIADLERHNSPAQMSRRKSFARQHTYAKQLQKIELYCEQAGLQRPVAAAPLGENPSIEAFEATDEAYEQQ